MYILLQRAIGAVLGYLSMHIINGEDDSAEPCSLLRHVTTTSFSSGRRRQPWKSLVCNPIQKETQHLQPSATLLSSLLQAGSMIAEGIFRGCASTDEDTNLLQALDHWEAAASRAKLFDRVDCKVLS